MHLLKHSRITRIWYKHSSSYSTLHTCDTEVKHNKNQLEAILPHSSLPKILSERVLGKGPMIAQVGVYNQFKCSFSQSCFEVYEKGNVENMSIKSPKFHYVPTNTSKGWRKIKIYKLQRWLGDQWSPTSVRGSRVTDIGLPRGMTSISNPWLKEDVSTWRFHFSKDSFWGLGMHSQ